MKDVCFDLPVREAKEVKYEVLLPWEILNMSLKTDSDLQDAFKKLRNKHYSWAMFVIKTELDNKSVLRVQNQKKKTPSDKFSVTQYADSELDWSDFTAENEFTLSDLNVETSNATVKIEDSFEAIPDSAEGGTNVSGGSENVLYGVNDAGVGVSIDGLDSGDSDEEFDYGNEDKWDAGFG